MKANSWFSHEIKNLLAATIVVAILIFFTVTITDSGSTDKTVTVQGTSTLRESSDLVTMSVGVETQALTANEAEQSNKQISDRIYSSLQALGLDSTEYKTESYTIYPNKDWEKSGRIIDYTVIHTIIIETDKIDKAGQILDSVSTSGANSIYGVSFGLKEETRQRVQAEALKQATSLAKTKAEAIASGLGKSLGRVKTVSDSTVDYYPYMRSYAGVDGAESDVGITTEPGTVEVTTSVSVVYGLR